MKIRLFILGAIAAVGLPAALAQEVPQSWENAGLTPLSRTTYINNPETIRNDNTEGSDGVAITSNGNVIVGWEDDGDGLEDLEAIWTLYGAKAGTDIDGTLLQAPALTPDTEITSLITAGSVTSKFLSYFRADGSATPGATSWGPKIKANLFGTGMGMGATSFGLGYEVPEWWETQLGDDAVEQDFPSVQLLDNEGQPTAIVAGVDDDYAGRPGDIRIADWDFLSNGNVVIVGESRQGQDLVDIYGGAAAGNHAIFRIVDQQGNEVKAVSLVSETPEPNEMWHGVGATANGFAARFGQGGTTTIRMFDNDGNPTTGNINLAELTGFPITGLGGRGDNIGFHGNGVDAYVYAVSGQQDGTNAVWVTVLNDDGTVRWSRSAADDMVLSSVGGNVDAAMDLNGEVVAVFSDSQLANPAPFVMGRRFAADGTPVGNSFWVSEDEDPTIYQVLQSAEPRVALRDGLLAVLWESNNDYNWGYEYTAVALRTFAMYTPGTIESVGLERIVADTPIIVPEAAALGNWEPYASVLGTSTFLIEGNTFAEPGTANQRYVVALQPANGDPMRLGEGFYNDAGEPFMGQINLSRQNGNPGRVAGDKRPGAVNFMVGGEASPHALPEFQSGNRWTAFDRLADGRYGTVQIYALDPATLDQTPSSLALDSATGRTTSGTAPGNQVSRFGGDVAGLDNGNFVSVVEDRSNVFFEGTAAVATIFAPDGSIVKDSFLVFGSDIWANVAAFKGGFAVRAGDGAGGRAIYFFDNDGNPTGDANQSDSGVVFDAGRGDGTRLGGHINSPYVYLTGRESGGTDVKVAIWDSRDASFVTVASVNEAGFAADADRANLAVDALDRFTVGWVVKPADYEQQQVAARVLKFDAATQEITPLTATFLPFINVGKTNGIRTLQMAVAMTTKEICVAAKGEINLQNEPENGANSPQEVNFYTVFTHPAPVDDPTTPVGGGAVTDGLVAYWSFDGNLYDSIKDFHGTARGTVGIPYVDGKAGFGKAIKLNGENQFVEITGGDENELEFPGGSMSIAGWFRVDAFDTDWQALISKGEGENYRVARRAATGTIAYAGGVGEGADDVPAVNDGLWHHFVAVSDATGAEFGTALYIDGTRYGVNAALPVLDQSDFNLMIGENPGARNREWEGEIDDIALWNRVLTAGEVGTLYNGGAGTAISTLPGIEAPVAVSIVVNPDGTLTATWAVGVLEAAPSVLGPWEEVAGATSPYTITPNTDALFGRIRVD